MIVNFQRPESKVASVGNRRRTGIAVLVILLLCAFNPAHAQKPASASTTATAAPAPRKAESFDKTKSEIDQLLGPRLNPPPYSPGKFNPFADVRSAPTPGGPTTPVATPLSDPEILQKVVQQIKITGAVASEDRAYVIIDQENHREGDMISVDIGGGEKVDVRIKNIQNNRITLTLRDAEITFRFK